MAKVVTADTKTFIRFWLVPLGIGLLVAFLYAARTGLIVVGASIFLALALKPLVTAVRNFFQKRFGMDKKFSTLSAALAYLIVVVVIGGIIGIVGPVVGHETTMFVQRFPQTFEQTLGGWEGINNFGHSIGIHDLRGEIEQTITGWTGQITDALSKDLVAGVSGVASGITNLVLVLVLTMLFLLEGPKLATSFWKRLSQSGETSKSVAAAKRIVTRMANVVSIYVSRQVLIAIIDGAASCLIVFILSLFTGVSSGLAFPMGLITMTFYLIPMFGQFIGGTLVTVILLLTNPLAAIIFAIVYIIYAQIENNVLSPKIQGNALGLPAVVILCAVIIGMYMAGLLGAIIAIPIAGCIRVLLDEYPKIKAAHEG